MCCCHTKFVQTYIKVLLLLLAYKASTVIRYICVEIKLIFSFVVSLSAS